MNTAASVTMIDPPATPGRRISVMHLIHTVAYGGVETAIINWLRKLDSARFESHLVCFANPGGTEQPFIEVARERGFRVDTIRWNRRKPILSAALRLARLMRQYRVEVLHTHNTYADLVGLIAARMAPARTITTLYVWANFHWRRNLLQKVNRWLLPHFDLVSAHCEQTYRKTLDSGLNPEKLRLLICGYEATRTNYTSEQRRWRRREMGIKDGEIVLANIARLYPEKAQDQLLRMFPAVLQKHPQARLWIAGIGPLGRELRSLCSRLGLDSSVRFLGFVQDLPELLALVDIQVSTSVAEGVPLAICAGMAAGLPIVATDVGGLAEVLDHGRAGRLVSSGQETAFLNALSGLIDDPTERVRLGRAARSFIENDYSLEMAVRRLERTYMEVIGECA